MSTISKEHYQEESPNEGSFLADALANRIAESAREGYGGYPGPGRKLSSGGEFSTVLVAFPEWLRGH